MFKIHYACCVNCHERRLLVVKKGYCQKCNNLLKPKNKRVKKISYAKKATGELELFYEIIAERGPHSEISGEYIVDPGPINFMHLLPKSTHRAFRLNKDNIIIGTAEEHHVFDCTSKLKLRLDPKWDKVFEKIDKLREEYKLSIY